MGGSKTGTCRASRKLAFGLLLVVTQAGLVNGDCAAGEERSTATMTCGGSCGGGCSPSSGATSGTISDGSGSYNNNEDCWWLIAAPGAEISVRFSSFNTESGYDYVKIYTSSSEDASDRIASLSGSGSSSTYSSSTGYLRVTFTSDDIIYGNGFYGTWWACTRCAPGQYAVSGAKAVGCPACIALCRWATCVYTGVRARRAGTNAHAHMRTCAPSRAGGGGQACAML